MSDNLTCPECGAEMVLRQSKFKNPYFFGCSRYPACSGSHGAHPDGRPLGIPADKATKEARILAHEAFDRLWKGAGSATTRRKAYALLAEAFGKDAIHIGELNIEMCNRVIQESNKLFDKFKPTKTEAGDE